jgi:hypothetical protein
VSKIANPNPKLTSHSFRWFELFSKGDPLSFPNIGFEVKTEDFPLCFVLVFLAFDAHYDEGTVIRTSCTKMIASSTSSCIKICSKREC